MSFLVRLVVLHNFKDPIKFLTETLSTILSNSIIFGSIIIIMFLFVYLAIALSETLFYRNGIFGLISITGIFVVYGLLIKITSFLLNLITTAKLPTGISNQENILFIVPIIENSYYNIMNIFSVIILTIATFIGSSRIIDKHLNL